jgi:hypothetical protein
MNANVYWIDGTVQIIDNGDGNWSVTDNGDETGDLDYENAMRVALECVITDEDVEAWHNGDGMTAHLYTAWQKFPSPRVFQVWGSRDGSEPLSITITSEEIKL